jgi:hypothetical protein
MVDVGDDREVTNRLHSIFYRLYIQCFFLFIIILENRFTSKKKEVEKQPLFKS